MELESTLRSAGYQVLGPAPTVSAALKLLRADRPDAAVLDVSLAGERVTAVAEVLLAMLVPFVLASGYNGADVHDELVLRDAVNIGKPSRPELLLKKLRDMLQGTDPELH